MQKGAVPMFLKDLDEHIKTYEDLLTDQRQELARLTERLTVLEKIHAESLAVVAQNNADNTARHRLDETEREIEAIRNDMVTQKRRMQSRSRSLRTRLLQEQEAALAALQIRLKESHDTVHNLKGVLIPEAEAHLAALHEKVAASEEETRTIQKETERINRLEIDTLF